MREAPITQSDGKKTKLELIGKKFLLKGVKTPDYIWYADKPLLLGGKARKLSIAEFEEKFPGFTYAENICVDDDLQFVSPPDSENPVHLLGKVKSRLIAPLNDKLVVCYINKEVGHGLFARTDIPLGEIVAIYAGYMGRKDEYGMSGDYALSIDTINTGSNAKLLVDAEKIGGLSRFIQHMPYHPEVLAKKLTKYFLRHSDKIERYLRELPDMVNTSENKMSQFVRNFKIGLRSSSPQPHSYIYNMVNSGTDKWELESLQLKPALKEVAWSNVTSFQVSVDKKTLIMCFRAEQNIREGEQLGFPYGPAYWGNKQALPLLFNRQGDLIDKSRYRYHRLPMAVKSAIQNGQPPRLFFFSEARYKTLQGSRSPVSFGLFSQRISFFSLRKKMVQQRVLTDSHEQLPSNTFVKECKDILPEEIDIASFNRFPDTKDDKKQWLVDVVLTTSNKAWWQELSQFFKSSVIKKYCMYFEKTQEIVISGVNISPKVIIKGVESANPIFHKVVESLRTEVERMREEVEAQQTMSSRSGQSSFK